MPVPLSKILDVPPPPQQGPEKRLSSAEFTTSPNFSLADRNISKDDLLKRLVYDDGNFENAIVLLDIYLQDLALVSDSPAASYETLRQQLCCGVLETDTQVNFHLAVGAPTLKALSVIKPGFSVQASYSDEDVTEDTWLYLEKSLLNIEFKTERVFFLRVYRRSSSSI